MISTNLDNNGEGHVKRPSSLKNKQTDKKTNRLWQTLLKGTDRALTNFQRHIFTYTLTQHLLMEACVQTACHKISCTDRVRTPWPRRYSLFVFLRSLSLSPRSSLVDHSLHEENIRSKRGLLNWHAKTRRVWITSLSFTSRLKTWHTFVNAEQQQNDRYNVCFSNDTHCA